MKNQDLDELIRRKLNVSSRVPDYIWDRIEQELDEQEVTDEPQKMKFWNFTRLLAAGVAAAVLVTAGWMTMNLDQDNGHNISDQESVAKVKTDIENNQSTTQDDADPSTTTVDHDILTVAQNVNDIHRPYVKDGIIGDPNDIKVGQSDGSNSMLAHLEPLPIHVSPKLAMNEAVPIEGQVPVQRLKVLSYEDQETKSIVSVPQHGFGLQDQHIERLTFDGSSSQSDEAKPQSKQLYYGVSGGYNYGSLDQGGAVAFTTRKNLNNRFFLDGSMGFVLNNSSPEQLNFKGDFIAAKSKKSNEPQMMSSTNKFTESDAFYFLQVNPTIGINVNKFMDVSVGPDYQQMLSNANSDVVRFHDNKSQLLPRHDFGLTSKAEFALTKNLKAGILFREGITPILANDNNITNRRYIQVQLKVQIPHSNKN